MRNSGRDFQHSSALPCRGRDNDWETLSGTGWYLMTISLPSGLRIVMNPLLPWESRWGALEIRCTGAFHPRHITTRLCLRILDQYRRDIAQTRILDVGCGTGVLALAAVRLGARSAVGVDISWPAMGWIG
jgi:ribosomal protein L11 methyltransferase